MSYPGRSTVSQSRSTTIEDQQLTHKVKEACGDTACEKLMCGISVFLWLMAFVEMPALFVYATSYDLADDESSQYYEEEGGLSDAVEWCYVAVFIALVMNCCSVMNWWGCFRNTKCSTTACGQCSWKFAEVVVWGTILFTITNYVEAPVASGESGYDINVPDWVLSDWYGTVAWIGIIGTVIEMHLFFLWLCFCKKQDDKDTLRTPLKKLFCPWCE
eukprot:580979_1